MFNNVGKKIKTLAVIMFVIFMIISTAVACGITYLIISSDSDNLTYIILGLLSFVLIEAIGTFISWLSVLMQYAFGELVDTNQKQVRQNNIIVELLGGEKATSEQISQKRVTKENGRHYTDYTFGAMDIPGDSNKYGGYYGSVKLQSKSIWRVFVDIFVAVCFMLCFNLCFIFN